MMPTFLSRLAWQSTLAPYAKTRRFQCPRICVRFYCALFVMILIVPNNTESFTHNRNVVSVALKSVCMKWQTCPVPNRKQNTITSGFCTNVRNLLYQNEWISHGNDETFDHMSWCISWRSYRSFELTLEVRREAPFTHMDLPSGS